MKPLTVRGLSKSFGGLQALRDVSLEVEQGERRVVIGPNGAGKTTLFNLLSGLLPPSSGKIWLGGLDVTRKPPHARAMLGLARTFQITTLFSNLSVLDNVILAVQAHQECKFALHRPVTSYPHLGNRAQELLEEGGLWGKRDMEVAHLSNGEQRQLEVTLALAGSPKVLLLDEPTAGLFPSETLAMTEALRRLDRAKTLVMVSHDMDLAFGIADKISVLHMGELLLEGPPETIKGNSKVNEIYLGAL